MKKDYIIRLETEKEYEETLNKAGALFKAVHLAANNLEID